MAETGTEKLSLYLKNGTIQASGVSSVWSGPVRWSEHRGCKQSKDAAQVLRWEIRWYKQNWDDSKEDEGIMWHSVLGRLFLGLSFDQLPPASSHRGFWWKYWDWVQGHNNATILFQVSRTRVVRLHRIKSHHVTVTTCQDEKKLYKNIVKFYLVERLSLIGTEVQLTIGLNEVLVTHCWALSSSCHLIVPSAVVPRLGSAEKSKFRKTLEIDRPN